jgi:hypothetical protein
MTPLGFSAHRECVLRKRDVKTMEGTRRLSFCAGCVACSEADIPHDEKGPAGIRLEERGAGITVSISAWNVLLRYAEG